MEALRGGVDWINGPVNISLEISSLAQDRRL
jgi:hypothetical protein